MLRSSGSASRPCVRSTSWSRFSTRFGWARKMRSRRNSAPLSEATTPAGRHQVAVHGVQPPAGEAELAAVVRAAGSAAGCARAQHDLDARQQLARVERLGQVVVGAHLQADDAVGLVAARGQHDHRDFRLRAQLAAQRQPVVAGQHHVEHDQVEVPARSRHATWPCRRRRRSAQPVASRGRRRAGCGFRRRRRRSGCGPTDPWVHCNRFAAAASRLRVTYCVNTASRHRRVQKGFAVTWSAYVAALQ